MQRNVGGVRPSPVKSTRRYIAWGIVWVNEGQMNRPFKSPKLIGYEHERKGYDERKGPRCIHASTRARMQNAWNAFR